MTVVIPVALIWTFLFVFSVMAFALSLKAVFIYKLLVMGLEDRKFTVLETQRLKDVATSVENELQARAKVIKSDDDAAKERLEKQLTAIDSKVTEGIDVARAAAEKSAEAVDVANHVNEKIEATNKNIEATLKHLDEKHPVDVRVVNEPLTVEQAKKKP